MSSLKTNVTIFHRYGQGHGQGHNRGCGKNNIQPSRGHETF